MDLSLLWAALAIWLAWLWVTIGEWLVAKTSIEALWKNPELWATLRKITILGIALVESAAIYWLIIALLITFTDGIEAWQAIAAGLAIGLPWFGAWLGEGRVVSSALKSVLRNPSAEKDILGNMILYIALVESAAIYGLIMSLLILFT